MAPVIKTVVYPVKDLEGTKALFGALLGTAPVVDEPYYVQFEAGEQQIGLDPGGTHQGITGPVPYCEVEDIERTVKEMENAGGEVRSPARDVGGGKLVAVVLTSDGNPIGLSQSP